MSNGILLIGGGSHCHSVIDTLCRSTQYDKIGIVAKDENNLKELEKDIIVADFLLGLDADLPKLFSEGWNNAFITLGSIGNPNGRKIIYSQISQIGFHIPAIIDKSATISTNTKIAAGVFVGKSAVINIGSVIGECAIINTGAIIEHDCMIGDFTHVSPGTVICGQVTVGTDSHIGAGSVVKQGTIIGSNTLIGAGSVVVKNIPDNVKAFGNPCRVIE